MNKVYPIVAALLLISFLIPSVLAWDVTPETGLVAYWGLDNNLDANDKHDNTYNGVNTAVYSVPGKIGNAYLYTKALSSQTVFTASSDLYMSGEVTLAAWVKIGKNNGTNLKCFVSKIATGGFQNYFLCINGMTGAPYNNVAYFVNSRIAGSYQVTGATQDLNDGGWHFLVGKGNSTGLYIYVDGVLDGFVANTNTPKALGVTQPMYFGYDQGVYFDSNLDEVGLWNRALSAPDITTLYNAGSGYTYCTNVGTFGAAGSCSSARLRVSTKDEKTWGDLNAVITIDGVSYTMTSTNFDINLVPISSGAKNVIISKNGYTTRNYQFINNGTDVDINMLLNSSPISTEFQFKVHNTITYATNTYVKMDLNGHDSNIWSIGRYLTDASGKATIPIDSNSQRYITSFSYGGTGYRIAPVYLTIKNPRSELTDLNIPFNYNITLSNLYNYSYLDRNIPKDIYIVPNTTDYYFAFIDTNELTYLGRNYFIRYDSNDANTQTLQPYLPLTSDVPVYVNFVTRAKNKNVIPYVDFLIYKNIAGVKTQIMSGRTDITGSRLFPFIFNENYSIDVFKDGIMFESAYLYSASATPVYWFMNLGTNDINVEQYTVPTYITFTPNGPKLIGTDITITVNMAADNITHWRARFFQYNDINMMTGKKYFAAAPTDGACAGSSCIAVITIPSMDINKSFYLDFNMEYNGQVKQIIKVYSKTVISNLDPFRLAFNVRKDMGCSLDPNSPCALGIIISVIITLILLFAIMKIAGIFFGLGSVVIAMFLLGLFTFVGWFFWPLYIFLLVGAAIAGVSGFARGGGNV